MRYIIEDALPRDEYLKLEELVTGENIQWVLHKGTCGEQTNYGDWRFTHTVYHQRFLQSNNSLKEFMPVFNIAPQIETMIFCKLNCDIYTTEPQQRPWHVDQKCNCEYSWTSILYFNDCNGKTIFRDDGVTIESRRNRAIVFNSELEHTGITQTDSPRRYVLNTNFLSHQNPIGESF